MSELQQTKRELLEVLDRIPVSGSFEGAELAQRASSLIEKFKELKSRELQLDTLPAETAPTTSEDSSG
jgi:hypothetical protein